MCLSCLVVACCGHSCRGSRNGGMKPLWGEKFMAQWHPLCRRSSHFPREFHAFRLYCIDFHAWNSLILKDNIIDAIWCKEWPIFNTGSSVGYSEAVCSRTNYPDSFLSAPTLTCFQLYYRSARWLRGGFHKVTWPSLFHHGVGVTLPWAPVSGDSGKMDGAWDSGMGSSFYLFIYLYRLVHFPQGLGEAMLQWTSAAWLQMQRSYPDQHLLSDVKSRALETSLLKWLCTKHW